MLRLYLACAVAVLGACAMEAAQPLGEPSSLRDEVDPRGWRCPEGARAVVDDQQILAGLDFAAVDVLAIAIGEHRAALRWSDDRELQIAPDSGEGTLEVRIERTGDAVLFTPETVVIAHGTTCVPWLEIPVRVGLRSDARGLNERFDATLRSTHSNVAELDVVTSGEALGGDLQALWVDGSEEIAPSALELRVVVSAGGVSGELSGSWNVPATTVAPARIEGRRIASWGVADCGGRMFAVGFEEPTHGRLGQALLDRIANIGPLRLTWSDGARTTAHVSFGSAFPGGCAWFYDAVAFQMRVQGMLSVRSDDGRFEGQYDTWATIDSEQAFTPLGIDLGFEVFVDAAKTPAELGFVEVATDAVDGASASMMLLLDAEGNVHPESNITLWRHVPHCQPGTPEQPPGCVDILEAAQRATFSR